MRTTATRPCARALKPRLGLLPGDFFHRLPAPSPYPYYLAIRGETSRIRSISIVTSSYPYGSILRSPARLFFHVSFFSAPDFSLICPSFSPFIPFFATASRSFPFYGCSGRHCDTSSQTRKKPDAIMDDTVGSGKSLPVARTSVIAFATWPLVQRPSTSMFVGCGPFPAAIES